MRVYWKRCIWMSVLVPKAVERQLIVCLSRAFTRLRKSEGVIIPDAILTYAVEFEASEKFRKTEKINDSLYVSCLHDSADQQISVWQPWEVNKFKIQLPTLFLSRVDNYLLTLNCNRRRNLTRKKKRSLLSYPGNTKNEGIIMETLIPKAIALTG